MHSHYRDQLWNSPNPNLQIVRNLISDYEHSIELAQARENALKECKALAAKEPLHYQPIEYYLEKVGNPKSYQELLDDYAKVLSKIKNLETTCVCKTTKPVNPYPMR